MAAERHYDPAVDASAAQEEAIRPLLARANLLRLRGQWEGAIAVCTEALRQSPNSASAHSLLGDVYEAQGRPDDAAQWFAMAVDLAPDNSVDRAKLERVLKAQRTRFAAEAGRAALVPVSPAPLKPAAEKTLEWFDRVFPPGKSDSVARLIFAVCGGVAVLLLLGAAFLYTTIHREPDAAETTNPLTISDSSVLREPVVMTPPPLPAAVAIASPTTATRPTEVVQPVPVAAPPSSLRSQFATLLPGVTVVSATSDAREGLMLLEIVLPPAAETETLDKTRERVVRAAAAAVRAAVMSAGGQTATTQQPALVRVSVRATTARHRENGSPAVAVPALLAEASPLSLRGMDTSAVPLLELLGRFSTLQWAGGFLPENVALQPAARGAAVISTEPSPVPNTPASPRSATDTPNPPLTVSASTSH